MKDQIILQTTPKEQKSINNTYLLPNEKGWHVGTLLNLSAIKKYKWGTKCLVKAYHLKTSAKLMKVSSSFIFELFSPKKGCLFVYFMLL